MGFLDNWRTLFSKTKEPEPAPVDLNSVLQQIKQKEAELKIEPGRKIHAFEYGFLEIRFDRDITLNGRICIFNGKERLFTFTVFAKQGDYDSLEQAFIAVLEFIAGGQSFKKLPDNEILKGYINH